jgi:hypothetical protein
MRGRDRGHQIPRVAKLLSAIEAECVGEGLLKLGRIGRGGVCGVGHGWALTGERIENEPHANPTLVGRATEPGTVYRWDMNGGTDQFQACEFQDGSGWNVLASLPGHAPAQLSGFESEAEALAWIETRAAGYANAVNGSGALACAVCAGDLGEQIVAGDIVR